MIVLFSFFQQNDTIAKDVKPELITNMSNVRIKQAGWQVR